VAKTGALEQQSNTPFCKKKKLKYGKLQENFALALAAVPKRVVSVLLSLTASKYCTQMKRNRTQGTL
jgi:hypothetical protein